jgi:hypothetical protein
VTSGSSSQDNNNKPDDKESEEDLWILWGKIINEWDIWMKKKQPQTKVGPEFFYFLNFWRRECPMGRMSKLKLYICRI